MHISEEDLRALRQRLPRGYRAEVLAKLRALNPPVHRSQQFVSMVVAGIRFDERILTMCIDIAEQNQTRLRTLAERLQRGLK